MGNTSSCHVNTSTGRVRLHCHWAVLTSPPCIHGLLYLLFISGRTPPAFHAGTQKELVVLVEHRGLRAASGQADYPCDASDGPDPRACQIRCGDPCVEPYRLCLAHAECHGIVINAKLTFATLKRSVLERDAMGLRWGAPTTIGSMDAWHRWIRSASPRLDRPGYG